MDLSEDAGRILEALSSANAGSAVDYAVRGDPTAWLAAWSAEDQEDWLIGWIHGTLRQTGRLPGDASGEAFERIRAALPTARVAYILRGP